MSGLFESAGIGRWRKDKIAGHARDGKIGTAPIFYPAVSAMAFWIKGIFVRGGFAPCGICKPQAMKGALKLDSGGLAIDSIGGES